MEDISGAPRIVSGMTEDEAVSTGQKVENEPKAELRMKKYSEREMHSSYQA
ncbi:MAG: hypothetical protein ACLU6W_09940 [Lachnospiraceae bacterium]